MMRVDGRGEGDDIVSPRLVLRLMGDAVVAACLAGEMGWAGALLGVEVPAVLLDRPSSMRFARARLAEDAGYARWSIRAVIARESGAMVGHVRFHSRPDPAELRDLGPGVVELGYRIFPAWQRRGYATEATEAAVGWAAREFGVRRFVLSIAPGNTASLGVAGRLGFVKLRERMDDEDGVKGVYLREVAGEATG